MIAEIFSKAQKKKSAKARQFFVKDFENLLRALRG